MTKQDQIQITEDDHSPEIHCPGKKINDYTRQSGEENPMVVVLLDEASE